MTLTYVFHSCFVLETDKSILILKEFTDEKGIPLWEISREGETIEI